MKMIYPLVLAFALGGCASTPDLATARVRAVSAIQGAQKLSTQALVSGQITKAQDQAAQAKFVKARQTAIDATTAAEALKAATDVGVTP